MADYRIYHLDPAGKIAAGEWLRADSDSEAVRSAREFQKTGFPSIEIWRGAQRLAVIDCGDPSDASAD